MTTAGVQSPSGLFLSGEAMFCAVDSCAQSSSSTLVCLQRC